MTAYVSHIPGLPADTSAYDRLAHGKAARKRLPRKGIRDWQPAADRPRSVDLLVGQETTRIAQLLPVRHARMAQSPFTFYRGAAIVMASDLGRAPNSGLWVQLCGDAHLSNFGVFGTPERNLVFDPNDFDETSPGPFEWDVLRLSASVVLAARDNGMADVAGRACAVAAATSYQDVIRVAELRPYLDNWYTMITPEAILAVADQHISAKRAKKLDKSMAKSVAKAKRRDTWSAVRKLTEVGPDGRRRFLSQPPLLVPISDIDPAAGIDASIFADLFATFLSSMAPDRAALLSRYTLLDVAHKVVGVGSVGLPAIIGLLQGRDANDLIVLQFKAAQESVLEKWTAPSPFPQHGQRVVVGQRLMQSAGDPFLGWLEAPKMHFYGRQLRDFKWSVDLAGIRPEMLHDYAQMCGAALAKSHIRAGDSVAISGYLGASDAFAESVADFSLAYADIMESDFEDFTAAIASGELEAASRSDAGI